MCIFVITKILLLTGKNCDEDIVDCKENSCPPSATCIDLTGKFYCQCPFNLTGDDCRKSKQFTNLNMLLLIPVDSYNTCKIIKWKQTNNLCFVKITISGYKRKIQTWTGILNPDLQFRFEFFSWNVVKY